MTSKPKTNRYDAIIESIFHKYYKKGAEGVAFSRGDIEEAAKRLNIALPKNIGDLIYSFRFRTSFPQSIVKAAPAGKDWIIRLTGRGQYKFVANKVTIILPRPDLAVTKIPDATPGVIDRYALSDEQALLAKVRYNRLIDIFSGVTCYSLQSHLRTSVAGLGQVETDEIYIGLDRKGAHFVLPVQAKGGRDKQSIVQIEQDFVVSQEKFPGLICRPIAAQFMQDDTIALFEFEQEGDLIAVATEKHYKLVPRDELSAEEVRQYNSRQS